MGERDWREIARVAGAVLLVALLVAFVIDNRESVPVGFVFTERRAPLIWVLLVTAVLGAVVANVVGALVRRRRSR